MTFRFYAQLNDFLPPSRRGRRFEHRLTTPASVKDTIEAVGVPHPEVDLILVNGDAADFARRVEGDDDVAVFPRFRSIALDAMLRAGSDPPMPPRFALDQHLGKLASLLRLTGIDAELRHDDPELAALSATTGRVLLTRDVGLLKRATVRHGYWVRSTDPITQAEEVFERFDLSGATAPFSRCLRCNTPLVEASRDAVASRVPPRAASHFTRFTECSGCGRVYWEGTHFPKLQAIVDRVRTRRLR
jgi:uncharacterized protein with PIN domain